MQIINHQNKVARILLNADEFISIWKGEKIGDPRYNTFYEEATIEISQPDNSIHRGEKRQWAIFRNIEVTGMINLVDSSVTYRPINISGSFFHNRFQIQKGIFENFIIGQNPGENIFNDGLHILGGEFKNNTQIGSIGKLGNSQPCQVNIHRGKFITKLRIWGSKNCILDITSGEYFGGLSLNGSFSDIKISGGTYHSNLELESLYCNNNFQLIGDAKSKVLNTNQDWIEDGFPKFTKFINSGIIILGQLIIKKCLSISYISCDFLKFSVTSIGSSQNCFINDLRLVEFNNDVFISAKEDSSIIINSIKFLGCTTINTSTVRLDNLNINKLTFESQVTLGNFIISNIINEYYFASSFFEYYKNEIYKNVEIFFDTILRNEQKGKIAIKLSDLGNSKFFSCDLSKTDIEFESSKISEIFLIGTKLPEEIINAQGDITQIKIGYGQLKKAYLNIGDNLLANKYLVKEIQSFNTALKQSSSDFSDRFILWLNNLSSKHGQDWVRGFNFTWISGILIFFFYVSTIDDKPFVWGWDGYKNFYIAIKDTLKYFPEFLYPGHSFSFMVSDYQGWPIGIDMIGRIVIGYGIYQTLQAFRKFKIKT